MNWDRIEGEWKQRRGKAIQHWGKMMNDELAATAGKYEALVGRLQERYGVAREEADQQLKDFTKTIEQLKKTNSRLMHVQKTLHSKEMADRKRVSVNNPSGKHKLPLGVMKKAR
jgi:uncharacterized protein YjbJ (UPF0337 family)